MRETLGFDMPRKNKIEKVGWAAEGAAIALNNEGKSYREIADELSERFGKDISHNSVSNYLKSPNNERITKMQKRNRGEIAKEQTEKIIEYGSKLESMEEKLDIIMDETLDPKNKQDVGQILQVMKEIRKMMEFQKDYIEDVTQPQTQINNVEVNNNTAIQLSEKLMEYEDKGIIEIKEPTRLK